ncbi:MAG: hypothetical protein AAGJ73_06775 [Pseudomonadota bacterium]
MRKIPVIAIAAALMLPSAGALAEIVAEQRVEQERVKRNADGSVRLERIKAEKVAPGDEVIYSVNFTNQGAEPAADLVMVMPVPVEVTYVEGSASGAPATVTFSADGGRTYLTRGNLTIRENGAERIATGDDITHIKWALNDALTPSASGEVAYRGVVK